MSHQNESPSANSSGDAGKNRLSVAEVAALTSQFFPGKNPEELDYDLKPFSTEKLGYLGCHELLTIEARELDGDAQKTRKNLTFFVKSLAPTGNAFDRLILREESKFFGEVMPRLIEDFQFELWAAKSYLVREDLMVLEDLRVQGFKVTKATDQLDVNRLRSAVSCVARFHASSMLLEAKLRQPLGKFYQGFFREKVFTKEDEFSWKWLLSGIEVVEAVARKLGLDPKGACAAYELMLEKIKPSERERKVFCHSDLWSNNMMFRDEEDGGVSCRLVDFQMLTYVSYAVDLVQLLHLNVPRDTRRRLEKDLVGFYHSVLVECLQNHGLGTDSILRLEEILRDVEEKRICGLVTAVQYFPIALLNKELSEEYTEDTERLEGYMYISRKDFTMKAMRLDADYRRRVEEAVQELMEFMQNRQICAV